VRAVAAERQVRFLDQARSGNRCLKVDDHDPQPAAVAEKANYVDQFRSLVPLSCHVML
jgi:hypothetical protein